MQKINEDITMCFAKDIIQGTLYNIFGFAYIKFPNKEMATTKAFAFSRFKKQTPKLSS